MIIFLFKIYIDKGIIKCKTRKLLLEDNRFIYTDKKGNEHSFEWEDITKLKLTAVKMGYRLSVVLPQFRFSFFSYEFVLNPIRFKDTLKMKGFEDNLNNLFAEGKTLESEIMNNLKNLNYE